MYATLRHRYHRADLLGRQLIGWVGGVTHVIDTGAVTGLDVHRPDSSASATATWLPAARPGVERRAAARLVATNRSARCTPKYWIRREDPHRRCHMIRELVEEVIRADGLEAYEKFSHEVIEGAPRPHEPYQGR